MAPIGRECAPGLSLRAMIQSVDISSPWELLYLIDLVGIERNMPSNLHNWTKGILVRPHRVDGLLSSRGNAVVTAIAFVRTVGSVVRSLQLGKINVPTRNVLNGRIRSFAESQGILSIGNHTARNGYDNASGIALDGIG